MDVPTSSLLHRILYSALIEIRMGATEDRRQWIFDMADLLHTLPLQLDRVARGELAADDVMRHLQARAEPRRLTPWLDQRIVEARCYLTATI